MRADDPWSPDREWGAEVFNYVANVDKREKAADERAERLARIHTDGWRNFTTAVREGLRDIADALRTNR